MLHKVMREWTWRASHAAYCMKALWPESAGSRKMPEMWARLENCRKSQQADEPQSQGTWSCRISDLQIAQQVILGAICLYLAQQQRKVSELSGFLWCENTELLPFPGVKENAFKQVSEDQKSRPVTYSIHSATVTLSTSIHLPTFYY